MLRKERKQEEREEIGVKKTGGEKANEETNTGEGFRKLGIESGVVVECC